jgi:hypothetical protein
MLFPERCEVCARLHLASALFRSLFNLFTHAFLPFFLLAPAPHERLNAQLLHCDRLNSHNRPRRDPQPLALVQ